MGNSGNPKDSSVVSDTEFEQPSITSDVSKPLEDTQNAVGTGADVQGGVSGEESFTGVNVDDINPEDLDEDSLSVYNDLVQRNANMDRDYRQKTQAISAIRNDAAMWQKIQGSPQLLNVITSALAHNDKTGGLDGFSYGASPEVIESEPTPDREADPEGYARAMFKGLIEEAISPLRDQLSGVGGFMENRQSAMEFQQLVASTPAAEAIGMDRLRSIQQRYTGINGGNISMQEAYGILSVTNPAILAGNTTNGNVTATGKTRVTQKPKERSSSRVDGRGQGIRVASGVEGLKAEAERTKDKSLLQLATEAITDFVG